MEEQDFEQLRDLLTTETEFGNYGQVYEDYLKQEKKVFDLIIDSFEKRKFELPQGITRETTIEDFNQLAFSDHSDPSMGANDRSLSFHLAINWFIERDMSQDYSVEKTAEVVASLIDLNISQTEIGQWLLVLHDLTNEDILITWSKLETDLSSVKEINQALKDIEISKQNHCIRNSVREELIRSLTFLHGEHDNLRDLANSIISHCEFDMSDNQITDAPQNSYFLGEVYRLCDGYIDQSLIPVIINNVYKDLKYRGYR